MDNSNSSSNPYVNNPNNTATTNPDNTAQQPASTPQYVQQPYYAEQSAQPGYTAQPVGAQNAYMPPQAEPYTEPTYHAPTPQYTQPQQAPQTPPAASENITYVAQPPVQPQSAYPQPLSVQQRSKIAAGILGILFGSLGVHNFYLGNTSKGIIQLMLTLVGWIVLIGPFVAALWGFVEGLLILCSRQGSPWHQDSRGVELYD